jgi:hypothetical protein
MRGSLCLAFCGKGFYCRCGTPGVSNFKTDPPPRLFKKGKIFFLGDILKEAETSSP